MINSRAVALNRADATSLYVSLFDKMRAGQVYNVPKVSANTVTPVNVDHMTLTTAQLPGGVIGVYGGSSATLPANNSIVMSKLAGAVGTGATTIVTDNFGNILNLVPITDATTNDDIIVPSNYATTALRERKVYGLLQTASTVTDGTAVHATVANCQISFVVFDATNTLQLVTLNQAIEFGTTQFRDGLHVPAIVRHGSDQLDDALSGGNIEYIERTFTVTAQVAVGEQLNVNTGATNGNGTVTTNTVVDGGVTVTNVNIQTSSANFISSPSLEIWDNGVPMVKGASPLSSPTEVAWVSATDISFYRVLDVGDIITLKIPLKNN
ncbi:hypothetical protein HYO65_gp249 [Tenacibaculum phage PTm1]|uniref:Uncharacterized protein n=2 Tax=Shirahamavirus PTm1 TaxID=2846435 RepID=A0A5S9HXQ1_9CAUD|nr:hypothetical protein HYO65_gp249 [Tenacibaculum phage PTm1]BBI90641.1 hypothetical protein [Tenacibaculum phage PTm1]BBI90948.1 hypothetical protein [Tenacibaculum phage PTm5]